MNVAIIGGGINGFCCAVRLLEHLKVATTVQTTVTVISDAFSPETTGDGSAGLWGPYLLGGTSTEKVHRWSKGMHDFLEELWRSEDAGEAGVCLIPVVRVTTNNATVDDFWKNIVYGCTELTPRQLDEYNANRQNKFTSGLYFVTYTSEPRLLLPYLMKRFQRQGGQIVQSNIRNMDEFLSNTRYDVVINCTGLGARTLLPDEKMFAVRGQVSRVKANWLYYVLLDESDDGNYIIPNAESVVLGGTHQEHDYNTNISAEDKQSIVHGCHNIIPSLTHAPHLYDWAGLRPGRRELRLELDARRSEMNQKIVIHNYGHGGSGVTLAWGCAADVLDLVLRELQKRNTPKSKL